MVDLDVVRMDVVGVDGGGDEGVDLEVGLDWDV